MLYARVFDDSRLSDVANLDCGDSKFGKLATDWIQCVNPADSALQSIKDRGTEVFLYYREDTDQIIGFGSVGTTPRKNRRGEETWSIIPHVGLHKDFHGEPAGLPWDKRYFTAVMLDLIGRCEQHGTTTLLLYVDVDNVRAQRAYARLNFENHHTPHNGLQKMVVTLPFARTS